MNTGLTTWRPQFLQPFREFDEVVDALMARLRGGPALPIDFVAHDGRYVLRAAVPGFTADELDVAAEDGSIEIRARRDEEQQEERDGWVARMTRSEQLYRRLQLPADADAAAATARLADGILTIEFPRNPAASRRIIQIRPTGAHRQQRLFGRLRGAARKLLPRRFRR